MRNNSYDLIIIGGGQSALACAYYLRRSKLEYIIVDNQAQCGGAWLHTWEALTLFSPAQFSSLPGWMMPASKGEYPDREEVISYLCEYEKRYNIPIQRSIEVKKVSREDALFKLDTNQGRMYSRVVIAATGTWMKPFIPDVRGRQLFEGKQVHSAHFKSAKEYQGKNVLIVGEGNSGAQILAEISKENRAIWATKKAPEYLPDEVNGKVLFDMASAKYFAEQRGEPFDPSHYSLGDIVMVPAVKEARSRGVLRTKGSFSEISQNGVIWDSGEEESFDLIIWCTGFHYATDYLEGLVERDHRGKIKTADTKAEEVEGLWLVGFGGWTGFASATLIGVGRSARATVKEIEEYLKDL
ncbi:ArsO family NAD(P)H-dependent flavin-containing monooxygenase [Anditalea andensis]|uniref:Pyridine nucleotide-disulfide oxidoreductase n=1 Tax=Anditalea andensis TaxID=1048983 RepID=A0A074KTE4_9BACT|nr:ArsO family NAD(P)H-dependent flavin-containing monooxygenase [Anditalea andensis]KEO72154.1 pyridine nucleotide-disulfide oxidoreductase [Anditalea andensis]